MLIPLQDTRPVDVDVEYAQIRQLFLRGYLQTSQLAAEREGRRLSVNNPEWAAKFRLLEAEAMVWRGLYGDALRLLDTPSTVITDHDETIKRLTLKSVSLTRLHQFSIAENALSQAENLCARQSIETCGGVPRARGVLALERGDAAEAQKFFMQSLSFARSHHDRWLEATALLNLGASSLQQEHYDEAAEWSTLAHRAAMALGGEDLAQTSLGNLGWAYFGLGDGERSLQNFLDARKSAARLGDPLFESKWITTAGYVFQTTGDYARASQAYVQALGLAREINSRGDIINSLEVLAHLSVETGKLKEAQAYIEQVAPLVDAGANRMDVLDVLFARGRLAAARHQDSEAESIFRIVENDLDNQTSMRLAAEYELAKLYESEGNAANADRTYRTALTTFESARAQLKNEDSKLPFLANATHVYDAYIHFLVTQGKTDEALAVADGSRARTLAQGLGLTTQTLSFKPAALHPGAIARKADATLLFYWLGEKQSYLWAITPQKTVLFPLPSQNEIAVLVKRYSESLLGPNTGFDSSNEDGLALYRILVEPASPLMRPDSTAVILDDGVLSGLNFETLLVPGPQPHYWIEDATTISAPSLYMLASAKSEARADRKLLLLGDAISTDPDYPELPMAGVEMRQIERHFAASDETIFARQQAYSAAYLKSMPQQYSYIHFVAHGIASRMDPLDSAIILSPSSGAADSFKLYAREIVQHPIHARLVTISSCSGSGSRSYAGEGLVGLSWAFLRAGAHNVIGALWEVSDDSTPRLMDALYQGIEDGLSPSVALRKAKLTLLHSEGRFRSPFFWAPFQIYAGL